MPSTARQPAGNTSGGQFAPHQHAEADIEIAADRPANSWVEPTPEDVRGQGVNVGLASWSFPQTGVLSSKRHHVVTASLTAHERSMYDAAAHLAADINTTVADDTSAATGEHTIALPDGTTATVEVEAYEGDLAHRGAGWGSYYGPEPDEYEPNGVEIIKQDGMPSWMRFDTDSHGMLYVAFPTRPPRSPDAA